MPEDQWETFEKKSITCKDTAATTAASTPCKDMKAQDTGIWFGRFCIINFEWVKSFGQSLKGVLGDILKRLEENNTLQNWVNDANKCWWIILASFGITLVLSFLYMHFLRCFASLITWVFILALIALLIIIGILALDWSKKKQETVD